MNIRNVTNFSNIALTLLLTSIGILVFHSLSIREDIYQSERHRLEALLLAEEMLHSSNDLTRMARTYVATGNPIYKRYFLEILEIRDGTRPRPLNYSPTYWHLVAAGKIEGVTYGPPVSLLEKFRRSRLKEEEFALLEESLKRSDKLANVEKRAFAAFEGLYDDGTGNFSVRGRPDRELAIQLLFNRDYLAEKAAIVEPVQRFMDLFTGRMQTQAVSGMARLEQQIMIEMILIFIALLAIMGIVFYTRLSILQPLAELGSQVAGVTRGIVPSRYGKATSNELKKLSEALALSDAEKQQLLEKERVARNEAERASQLKDEFLATLSHELRTPLNAILGWSQLILSGNMKEDDTHRGLETIERNARAQNKLIEDLLEMSSIISGKVRLDMQQLDVASLVDTAVESVRPTAQAKGVTLQKTITPYIGTIAGDPNRLQQVLWNLLSNSIKFTPKGGKIHIIVGWSGPTLEIRIKDSGLGISPEFIPYVFDRFRQGDASLTRQYGGLGLGLAIVKQLVELHGGIVRAESAGLGEGSSFIVNLPFAAEDTKNDPLPLLKEYDTEKKAALAGRKILVIDDEADARELINRILIYCKANVITAATATEGLELLKREKPDVVISDVSMPDKDGYQFINEVRQLTLENGGNIPAIALTAFARADDMTKAISAGYQKHLCKPVDSHELITAINQLVGGTKTDG
ncbi:signal transduction histidine kinase [Nitrosospira sp. Nsp2]|uniref:ATP-binding response regulator n=1 Tax=Nitrosospira sp. Nsp2 TaxID=136548 RepID=UPI000D311FE2|nr:ATP-binding protein [Nitrosospira sp. Nsp2]PTR16581.1 signal transduction histidine kinase [Nitrosospira sp. Nsp2]